jgi:predicted N-acyltransferase
MQELSEKEYIFGFLINGIFVHLTPTFCHKRGGSYDYSPTRRISAKLIYIYQLYISNFNIEDGVNMEVKIAGSIRELDKAQWDDIAGNNVMNSYGWLKTIEETFIEKIIPHIYYITDSRGIVSASACYILYLGNVFGSFDHVIFGSFLDYARKLKISFLPALICTPFSYSSHFLFREDVDLDKRKNAANKLLEAIEETVKRKHLSIAFINASDEETLLDGMLQTKGYPKILDMPLCYLDICWNSFKGYGEYLKSISKNIWKSVRREINKNNKEGVLIKQLEVVESREERLHELVNMNVDVHNKLPFMFSKLFYKRLKENLENNATIYAAFKKDSIIGVCISISRNGRSFIPIVGVDHEMSGNDCTYFNITYNRPIMDAISSGKTRIYFGRGMYELKRRRGCKVKNIFFYYKPYSMKQKILAIILFPLRSIWIRKMLPEKIRAG